MAAWFYAQFIDVTVPHRYVMHDVSGAGTNLKVRDMSGAKRQNVFVVPSTILAVRVQLVVLVSAFVMVSTVWSVSCLLFFY